MIRLLLPVSFFFLQSLSSAQIDQKKLDSLSTSIDASVKTYQQWQDSFNKVQMQKSIERSSINTIEFVKQYQEQNRKKEREQSIRYIIIGTALLSLLVIEFVRRRKAKAMKL